MLLKYGGCARHRFVSRVPPSGNDLIVLDCFPFRALHNFLKTFLLVPWEFIWCILSYSPIASLLPDPIPLQFPTYWTWCTFFLIHQLQLALLIFSWMCDLALQCGQHNGEHTHKEHRLFFSSSYCSASMVRTSYPHPFPTPGILSKLP